MCSTMIWIGVDNGESFYLPLLLTTPFSKGPSLNLTSSIIGECKQQDINIGVECKFDITQAETFQPHNDDCTPLQLIDVLFTAKRDDNTTPPCGVQLQRHAILLQEHGQEKQILNVADFEFLAICLRAAKQTPNKPRTARFIIPLQEGTIIRSDIISFRLHSATWAEKTASFAKPLQFFPGIPLSTQESCSLLEIFRASAGAILLDQSSSSTPTTIDQDFSSRLSLPIISKMPISKKKPRLVIVGTSNQPPSGGGWTQYAFGAARALGISLIIVDKADSWLTMGDYTAWYEELHLIDPTRSLSDVDEIVRVVSSIEGEIDGLSTFVEALQGPVTKAIERLGRQVPVPPREDGRALERATDKYALGKFLGRRVFLANTTTSDDENEMDLGLDLDLQFPIIVKPRFGLNSEGVSLIHNLSDLESTISRTKKEQKEKEREWIIEEYCAGPEVDVNMIFISGQMVFYEICDDFPKRAELSPPSTTSASDTCTARGTDFHETNMVFPSSLPPSEISSLRNAVEGTIQGLGFRNGVFHVEARVNGSRYEYRVSEQNGIMDLFPKRKQQEEEEEEGKEVVPKPWIIEVNPRPPGLFASQTPASTYGVDYWAVSLLLAVGDLERARVLSRPFISSSPTISLTTTIPTTTTVLVMIHADFDESRKGIFDSDDVCEELFTRCPDLRTCVGLSGCLLKRGQKIPHPGTGKNTFVAFFNVFSKKSRREALELAERVRREVRYEIR
ncbi:glutathione synthetase ATP-binding domain-like protein [Poronia punctata]|nr:glutathione synthetase ATP-binding domain-like protein [Poronia punctata]